MTTTSESLYKPFLQKGYVCEYKVAQPDILVGESNEDELVRNVYTQKSWCFHAARWWRQSGNGLSFLCPRHYDGRRDDNDYNK